jgi:hypothetical protein
MVQGSMDLFGAPVFGLTGLQVGHAPAQGDQFVH